MFKGIIELESLNNPGILKEIKIVKRYKENRPEANTKIWHTNLVKISFYEIKDTIKRISKYTKPEWYSIFWSKDIIFAVLKNKIFKLNRKNYLKSKEYKKFKNYAIKHGIQERYLDFKQEFSKFKSPSP